MAKVEPKKFVVRMRPDLHEQVVEFADKNHRSLNNLITVMAETYLDVELTRKHLAELERAVTD